MGEVLRAVSVAPSKHDAQLQASIELLLQKVKDGEVVGVAFVALKPGYDYYGDIAGAALQHPVMALGLSKALEYQISKILK